VLAADDIHYQETDTMCDIEHNVSMYLLFDRLVRVPSAGETLYSTSAVLGPIECTHSDGKLLESAFSYQSTACTVSADSKS
jgi:hypothetical protein